MEHVLIEMPPIEAGIQHGRIVLKSQFAHSDRINEIPGRRAHGKGRDYYDVPLTWVSLQLLVNLFGDALYLTPELELWANFYYQDVIEPSELLRAGQGEQFVTDELWFDIDALIPSERSSRTPTERRYQVSGALLLAIVKRFALFDEQGTGKMTEVALALSLYPQTLPALIVSPSSVLYSWKRELELFGIKAEILEGTPVQRRRLLETGDFQVLITTYGTLPKHTRIAGYGNISLTPEQKLLKELNGIEWATVVADEAHRIKDPKTVQTRAVWGVSENAEHRWVLTGTPIEKSPMEFWSLLHFLDPVAWPSSVKARDRWVDFEENFFGGLTVNGIIPERLDEWRAVTEWMWRRKEIEGLPPLESEVRYCQLKGKHLKMYKDMERQLMAETGDDDVVLFAQNHMVKAGRLKLMAQASIEVTEVPGIDGEDDSIEVIPVEPSPKLDLMMDTLEDFEGQPLLLWFSSVKFMRLAQARLTAKGITFGVIDGSMTPKKRDEVAQSFQRGDLDILLLSAKAASEGITLTRARIRIIVDRDWSFIVNSQLDRRNQRIGSEIHKSLVEVELVTEGTIEEKVREDRVKKQAMSHQVISPLSYS